MVDIRLVKFEMLLLSFKEALPKRDIQVLWITAVSLSYQWISLHKPISFVTGGAQQTPGACHIIIRARCYKYHAALSGAQ